MLEGLKRLLVGERSATAKMAWRDLEAGRVTYREAMRIADPDSVARKPLDVAFLNELLDLSLNASTAEADMTLAYLTRAFAEIRQLRRAVQALESGRKLCRHCGGQGERPVEPGGEADLEGWSHLECLACHGTGFVSIGGQP
ncbi:hypothetical protein [Phenylobacterium sp.]|uniref:hypothetical protein n=1 Tax=Phenylobacterium sp. TaxID=1871053 RepID=UPI002730656A|nr:hypothetical protein [Phenylobacterium sp.]MDP2214735.1 hypothetical protein [Phenylobacterium sp.]